MGKLKNHNYAFSKEAYSKRRHETDVKIRGCGWSIDFLGITFRAPLREWTPTEADGVSILNRSSSCFELPGLEAFCMKYLNYVPI